MQSKIREPRQYKDTLRSIDVINTNSLKEASLIQILWRSSYFNISFAGSFEVFSLQWPIEWTLHIFDIFSSSSHTMGITLCQIYLFASCVICLSYHVVLNCYQIENFQNVEKWVHYWLCLSFWEIRDKKPGTENRSHKKNPKRKISRSLKFCGKRRGSLFRFS